MANKTYAGGLRRQMPYLPKRNFLVEPESKNTAAAIGLASVVIKKIDPQAVTLVLSSDHMIGQKKVFLRTIKAACRQAKEYDGLITIGIRPRYPAEEFGYLKIIKNVKLKMQNEKIYRVEKFIEKPNFSKAKKYIKSKNYLWNSGIFAWKVTGILKEIREHLPKLYSGLQKIEKAWGRPEYKNRLIREYSRFKNISIDYGVMEKAGNIYAVAGDFSWQDLGSWNNLSPGLFTKDGRGNVIQGLHKGVDTCDCLIYSEGGHLIGTVGLRDLIIAHTPSATLICKKDRAQEVKKLTQIIEKDKRLRKYL